MESDAEQRNESAHAAAPAAIPATARCGPGRCRIKLSKEIELDIASEELEIDKTVADALSGPIVHRVHSCPRCNCNGLRQREELSVGLEARLEQSLQKNLVMTRTTSPRLRSMVLQLPNSYICFSIARRATM